jgi:hypothetical protein
MGGVFVKFIKKDNYLYSQNVYCLIIFLFMRLRVSKLVNLSICK